MTMVIAGRYLSVETGHVPSGYDYFSPIIR